MGYISRTRLFRNVAYDDVESIVSACRIIELTAGELVVEAGQKANCVWVVISGTLRVHFGESDSNDTLDVGQGECVGEISVADGKYSTAWVKAAAPSRLLVIDAETFLTRLLAMPRISRNLIGILAERMRSSTERLSRRVKAEMELKALQRELEFARRIQASMLPENPLASNESRIDGHGFMRAARQVGGDFYDAFRLDEDRFLFVVGDVCNKGMPAALFMAQTVAILRSMALRYVSDNKLALDELVSQGNEQLCMMNSEQLFVSLFVAIIDLTEDQIRYVNAGHNPPLLKLPDQQVKYLELPRNPIAGMVPGLAYTSGQHSFPPGSLLLLYTDGVTEAESANGIQLGELPVESMVSESAGTAAQLVEAIVTGIDLHASGYPQSDDITLLAVRRH